METYYANDTEQKYIMIQPAMLFTTILHNILLMNEHFIVFHFHHVRYWAYVFVHTLLTVTTHNFFYAL